MWVRKFGEQRWLGNQLPLQATSGLAPASAELCLTHLFVPKAKLQPPPFPTSQGQFLRGCCSATKTRARAQPALGKALLSGWAGLSESGKKMGKVQIYLTMQTQGFLCSTVLGRIYHQAVNGEHLQTTAQPGFIHLLPAKEAGWQISSSLPALPQSLSTLKWIGYPAWHDSSVQSQPAPGGKSTASLHLQMSWLFQHIQACQGLMAWRHRKVHYCLCSSNHVWKQRWSDFNVPVLFLTQPSSHNLPRKCTERV